MSDLLQHLKNERFSELFPAGEFTNATNFLYTALMSSVHDNADTLLIRQNGFEWYTNNKLIGTYLGGGTPIPPPSFNVIVREVLKYDVIVRNHMNIQHEDAEQTIITITQ